MALGTGWSTATLVGAALASLSAVAGFASAGAQGYWQDPFASVAPWTWIGWLTAVALAWTALLAGSRTSHHCAGAIILLGSILQLGLLARSKGMVASDGGDILTHAGWITDLLRDQTLPPILYPGMHAWGGALALLTGLPPLQTLESFYVPLMATTFVLGCGLLGRFALRESQPATAFALGMGLGSLPVAVFLKSLPIANHWAFLLLPLTAAALLRAFDPGTRHGAAWIVAAVALVGALAVGHPLMTPVVVLAVAGMGAVAALGRHPSWKGNRMPILLAVVTLIALNVVAVGMLLFNSDVGERLLHQAEQEGPDFSTGTPVGRQLDTAQGLGFGWADILRVALLNYVPIGMVAALAAIGVAWVSLGPARRSALPTDHLIAMVAMVGFAFLLMGTSTRFLGDFGVRAGRFLEYGGPLLVGAAAIGLGAPGIWRGRTAWVPLVAVLLVCGAGLGAAYKSPLTVQAWDAVPPSETVAASWYITHKEGKPVFVGPASGAYRFGTLFFGTEGLKADRPDAYQYTGFGVQWRNNFPKIPDNLAFQDVDYVCGDSATGRTALVFLPVGDLEPYLDGAYSVTGRLDPEDLAKWASPEGGFRVYDSGPRQVQIYTTPPHC